MVDDPEQRTLLDAAPGLLLGARQLNQAGTSIDVRFDHPLHRAGTHGTAEVPSVLVEQAVRQEHDTSAPLVVQLGAKAAAPAT
jgi:hypothetical protein